MAKHRLMISEEWYDDDFVVLYCTKCPKYISLDLKTLRYLLTARDDRLVRSRHLRRWNRCLAVE